MTKSVDWTESRLRESEVEVRLDISDWVRLTMIDSDARESLDNIRLSLSFSSFSFFFFYLSYAFLRICYMAQC